MERPKSRSLARKQRLGVVVDSLVPPYQQAIVRGAAEGADNAGASLLCFAGGPPTCGEGGDARPVVYDLVCAKNLDGALLCSGTLVGCSGSAAVCERFRPLPLCAIGALLEGQLSILVDNEVGMRRLVEHLITQHGSRNLAFLRGPLTNDDAEVRLDAYRQVLAAHHIPYRQELVVTGDFLESGGSRAVEHLARALGSEFDRIDTIVASNDSMALGAMTALNEIGVAVPQEKRVTGFDDIDEARLTEPQLSTVRQPLIGQGQTAVRLMMDRLQLGSVPPRTCLDTELVIRRSCGCDGGQRVAEYSSAPPGGFGFEAAVVVRRQKILDTMTRAARGAFGPAGSDWQQRLLNALLLDMRSGQPEAFPRAVRDVLHKLETRGVDFGVCFAVFEALREKIVPALRNDPDARDRAEDLLRAASRSIDDTILRHSRREQLRSAYLAREVAVVCNALATTFDRGKLVEAIQNGLPRIGIHRALVIVYPPKMPRASEVLISYGIGACSKISSGQRFDRQLVFPPECDVAEMEGCHFVLPLFLGSRALGHVILQHEVDFGYAFDSVTTALSCALYGADLQETCAGAR